jgi:signal transduction histidine kinase
LPVWPAPCGCYPPILAERGLVEALQAHARKATVPVFVEAGAINRHPQEQEAAVYFSVLEALQNVQKYAGASQATVRLSEADGVLRFEVDDDGCGFDLATVRKGSGLTDVADRLDALDGHLEIDSALGRGCRLRGVLPVPQTRLSQPQAGDRAGDIHGAVRILSS